jgi:hypothetical protein
MAGRWGPEGPPPEAYSRVTDPQRFAPVADAADALVERLVAAYDVTRDAAEVENTVRAVRLTPRAGAPLVVGVTDFPGVRLKMGHWSSAVAPQCGCDACDEDAADAIAHMTQVVDDVVHGRFRERLTRHPRRLWVSTGSSSGWSAVDREHYERLGSIAAPGSYEWPAWPTKARSST